MPDTLSAGAKAAQEVCDLIRARNPLIVIVTAEEARTERLLVDSLKSYAPVFWDCCDGLQAYGGAAIDAQLTDPVNALRRLRESQDRQVWFMRDLGAWWKDPMVCRTLRSTARALPMSPRDSARSIILLAPSIAEMPAELAGHATVYEWPLPDRAEIGELLDRAIEALPDSMKAAALLFNGAREAAIDAAVGLNAEEVQACYARSLIKSKRIDPAMVAAEKKRVVARERVLEWIDPPVAGLDAIGGLDLLKDWLGTRKAAFGAKARAYGLPAPKGALLVGVPGCGKSLTAKAIAAAWAMPLLRLDMGALRSKYVGDSEANIRKALRLAETVAPCVLWLDEVEKALAGATQGAADGGVSADALGVILSWMQDRAGSVFVIATANDVSKLPPELLRKGRFDELWFVDLPTYQERAAILRAALAAHRVGQPDDWLPEELGQLTRDFTGAEIAALVPDAMYRAFAEGGRAVSAADLVAAAQSTVPLAKTAAERLKAVREWAQGRARPASTPEAAGAVNAQAGRSLDV